jgi:hypothetical protein
MDGCADRAEPHEIGTGVFVEMRMPEHLAPDQVELVLDVQFDGDPFITTVVVALPGFVRRQVTGSQILTVGRNAAGEIAIVGTPGGAVPQCANGNGRGSPAQGGPRA